MLPCLVACVDLSRKDISNIMEKKSYTKLVKGKGKDFLNDIFCSITIHIP